MILIRVRGGKVINQWTLNNRADMQGRHNEDLIDVTDHPAGPQFMGRTYDGTTFGPVPVVEKTRREVLKEKTTWTQDETNEAIRMLL